MITYFSTVTWHSYRSRTGSLCNPSILNPNKHNDKHYQYMSSITPDRVPVEWYRVGLVSNSPVMGLRSLSKNPPQKEVYSEINLPIKMIFGSNFCPRGGVDINVLYGDSWGQGWGLKLIGALQQLINRNCCTCSSSYLPRLLNTGKKISQWVLLMYNN